jgi:hypothetical protein
VEYNRDSALQAPYGKELTLTTYRENTCFTASNDDTRVEVNVSGEYGGLLYILLHEVSHIVDYVERVTPHVEPGIRRLYAGEEDGFPFTEEYWDGYDVLDGSVKVNFQNRMSFYQEDHNRRVPSTAIPNVYMELRETPFCSTYSYISWAEDFAEYATMYYLTQSLGLRYAIEVFDGDGAILSYEPFRNPLVLRRMKNLELFAR